MSYYGNETSASTNTKYHLLGTSYMPCTVLSFSHTLFNLDCLFVYLFDRKIERERAEALMSGGGGRGRGDEGETDSLRSRKPNAGLDPRTPRS